MEQGEKNDGKGKNGAGRGGTGGYREPGATRTPAAQGGQSGRVQETITSVAKDRKAPSGGKSRTREADDAAIFA